jgi:phosphoketolase
MRSAGIAIKRGYWNWLEGYLLTSRHGVFSCYEAFIHIVDSTFNQHAGQESL